MPKPQTEPLTGKFKNPFKTHPNLLRPRMLVILLLLLSGLAVSPWVYQESWLSPFSTLDVPNHFLHPHAFTAIGYIKSADPAHPRFTADKALTQELLRDLEEARPLPAAQTLNSSSQDPIRHFVLHRDGSRFHSAADFALTYDPSLGLVRFGGEAFQVNQATQVLLNTLPNKMAAGWWKA